MSTPLPRVNQTMDFNGRSQHCACVYFSVTGCFYSNLAEAIVAKIRDRAKPYWANSRKTLDRIRTTWLRTRWSGVRVPPGAPRNQRVTAQLSALRTIESPISHQAASRAYSPRHISHSARTGETQLYIRSSYCGLERGYIGELTLVLASVHFRPILDTQRNF